MVMKRRMAFISLFLFLCALSLSVHAQEELTITGTVEEIAKDGTYIIVDGQKIMTSEEFIEDSYLVEGDRIAVLVNRTSQGLEAVDFDYVFDDEDSSEDDELEFDEPEDEDSHEGDDPYL
jgi:hypothetical protein